jgi:peptidoglycan hydrolase-like protein with peptidoglycan-binding domain
MIRRQLVVTSFCILKNAIFDLAKPLTKANEAPHHPAGQAVMPDGFSSVTPGTPGDEVRAAQQKLAAEGYDVRPSEGAITNDFRAAVREFQKDNGLVITGSLDSETVALLGINVSRSSG